MAVDTESDPLKEQRRARAKEYLDTDLRDQRGWYSRRASAHKKLAQRLGLIVIVSGALVTFVASLKPGDFSILDVVMAALGVTVAISQGILRIWRFDETWIEYRKASERMKRENRLYVNACGPYADLPGEDERYRHYVEANERIVAEEQQIYFQDGASRDKQEQPAEPQS